MSLPPVHTCPLPRSRVVDLYFMEHRARLIDVAAFLDRCDRAEDDGEAGKPDFRLAALREGLQILLDGKPDRARRVLDLFSDPTAEPIASALGMKGALGAYRAPE